MASFARDTLSVGVSKFLIIALGLAKAIIIARWLGPENNGLIAGLAIYPSLFMSVGSLGVRQATTYFVGSGRYALEQIKQAIVQLWLLSTVASLTASYLLVRYASTAGENLWLTCLAVAPIPFALFNTYNTGIFLGQNKIKQFNRINWIPHFFVLVLTIAFVIWIELGIHGAMAAAVFGPSIMTCILLRQHRFTASITRRINWRLLKAMLSLGSVYALALLLLNLNYKLDVILLDRLSTPYELGIYTKGAHVTEYLWHVPMLFSTIVLARSATASDSNAFSKKVCQLMRLSVLAVAILAILLAVIAQPLISLAFGDAFLGSVQTVWILLPGVVLLTTLKVAHVDLAGRGKPWLSMYATLPALLVNIALNIALIPAYGANGAAIASTASYSLAGLCTVPIYAAAIGSTLAQLVTIRRADFAALFRRFRLAAGNT